MRSSALGRTNTPGQASCPGSALSGVLETCGGESAETETANDGDGNGSPTTKDTVVVKRRLRLVREAR